MVIVRLMGGLGNQMFQYALGRHLSILNGCELLLDIRHFDFIPKQKQYYVKRKYDLDIFNLDARIYDSSKMRFMPQFNGKFTDRLLTKFMMSFNLSSKLYSMDIEIEKIVFEFDHEIFKNTDKIYLVGYWQNENYFKGISDIIRADFSISPNDDEKTSQLLQEIRFNNSVCLNIRRGDFVDNPTHGFLGEEYINKAVKMMASKVLNPSFYVFSDEIDWCKNNISFPYPTTFVSHEYAGKSFSQYLMLMTKCKHFIIPNSTFGWWGAWLAENKDKIIIAPRNWVNVPGLDGSKILPREWLII